MWVHTSAQTRSMRPRQETAFSAQPPYPAATYDGWRGLTPGNARTAHASALHMPYDGLDSLDYLVCLQVLPWERFGWLPARVVTEHVEWVLRTPLNAMQPQLVAQASRRFF